MPVYSLMIATEPLPDASGTRSASRARRRSPTAATSSSTGSAPPTAGSRSAAAARRTTSARASGRRSTATSACSPTLERTLRPTVPARSATPRSPTTGAARSACRATGTRRSASTARPASAWAGGYVGDGVRTTNLAGRTLADLVLGRDTELTAPAVGRPRVAAVGAGAAALARHQRRPSHRRFGRPLRGEAPAGGPLARPGHVLAHRRLIRAPWWSTTRRPSWSSSRRVRRRSPVRWPPRRRGR